MIPILVSFGAAIAARIVSAIASKFASAIGSSHQASHEASSPPFQSVLDQHVSGVFAQAPAVPSGKPPLPRTVDLAWLAPAPPPFATAASPSQLHHPTLPADIQAP